MKKLAGSLLVMLTLLSTAGLYADDKKDDKPKFPGKPGLEFRQILHSGGEGNMIKKTTTGEAGIYSRTEFRGQMAFTVIDKLYTLTPWARERLDLYFDAITADGAKSQTKTTGDDVKVKARNRFDIGFTNTFDIQKMIRITLDPAFRVENSLNRNIKDLTSKDDDGKLYDNIGPAVKFAFMPSLNLSGSYDIGFSWFLNNTLYFQMYPVMDLVNADSILEAVEYEATYNLSFNVLKALKIKDYNFSIFAEEYVFIGAKTENYQKKNIAYNNKTDHIEYGSYTLDNKIGVNSSFHGLGLFANSLIRMTGTVDTYGDKGSDVHAGFQAGGSVRVDKFDFGVTYTGTQHVWLGGAKNDDGKFAPRAVEDKDNKKWNNLVEGYFRIRF